MQLAEARRRCCGGPLPPGLGTARGSWPRWFGSGVDGRGCRLDRSLPFESADLGQGATDNQGTPGNARNEQERQDDIFLQVIDRKFFLCPKIAHLTTILYKILYSTSTAFNGIGVRKKIPRFLEGLIIKKDYLKLTRCSN